jgi:hypothetical protein
VGPEREQKQDVAEQDNRAVDGNESYQEDVREHRNASSSCSYLLVGSFSVRFKGESRVGFALAFWSKIIRIVESIFYSIAGSVSGWGSPVARARQKTEAGLWEWASARLDPSKLRR